jgi:hypothetical protein
VIALCVVTCVIGCEGAPIIVEAAYPEFWSPNQWQNALRGDDITEFHPGTSFSITLEIGIEGDLSDPPDYFTTWEQDHNPFLATTDGSDYTYIEGDEPVTCGGFNGLHNRHFVEGAASGISHARVSDVDSTDSVDCWTMQIVPLVEYRDAGAYLHGYEGILGEHMWQRLWLTPL